MLAAISDYAFIRLSDRVYCMLLAAGVSSLPACGRKSSDEPLPAAAAQAGMAISVVAPDYSSSRLLFQALDEGMPKGDLRTLLSGESSDPWTVTLNSKLYFFNRSTTSSNFRSFDPKEAEGKASAQIRTPQAASGDPHAALWLAEDRVLLANYIAGKLVVMNPADGTIQQEVNADWDLGSAPKAMFRPEALYRIENDGSQEIYVLKQGRNADYSGFTGAQQIFILKDNGSELTVLDLDPVQDRVQGIKLHVFNPQIIDGRGEPSRPIVGGLCTLFDKAQPCTSGFEQVDLKARTSSLLFDLSDASEKGNGNLVGGQDGKFYGAVATPDGQGRYQSHVREYDLNKKTAKVFYQIEDPDYAAYALAYHPSSQHLYIGEKNKDGTGRLSAFDLRSSGETPPATLELPLPPYHLSFVP